MAISGIDKYLQHLSHCRSHWMAVKNNSIQHEKCTCGLEEKRKELLDFLASKGV